MNTHLNILAAIALTIGVATVLPASADTVVVAKPSYNYVYYRDHEIYFRPETKVYYWKESGKWQSSSVLPSHASGYVTSGGVTVALDTERPYERHDMVVTKYSSTSTDSQGDTTTTEKTVNPDGSSTTVTTTTKRKYVYYADHDIYFAPENKTYYWRADGRWQSGSELPVASRGHVTSGGISIELDTDRPYTLHDYVVAHFKTPH